MTNSRDVLRRRCDLTSSTCWLFNVDTQCDNFICISSKHWRFCLQVGTCLCCKKVHWFLSFLPISTDRSTQPCIPPESLNRVPASVGIKAGKLPLPLREITCHVISRSGVVISITKCYIRFTFLHLTSQFGGMAQW